MVLLSDEGGGPRKPPPPISQARRNELNRALMFMLAKLRCRGHRLDCRLGALPRASVPRPAAGGLVVNPTFRYAPDGGIPAEVGRPAPPLDAFRRGLPLAWIAQPVTGVWWPFAAEDEWADVLATLEPGTPPPRTAPPHMVEAFVAAGILICREHEAEERAVLTTRAQEAATRFQRDGYAVLPGLLPPLVVAAMRRYYRGLVAGGMLPRGDDQVADRHRLHSEPAGMFLHPQLTGLVGRLAGEPVKPSYLYFACYPGGAALPRHIDRVQCEFSISLLVDYEPDPEGPCGWPLVLEHASLPDGVVAVDLAVGDALVYRGRRLAHYRDPLPAGHRSSSLFFHYVRHDFDGDAF